MAKARKFWEILAESQHDKLVLSWLSVVLTVLVIVLSDFLVGMAVRPKPVVVVPGAAVAGVYNAGEMPETVMVQFARNFVVDLANYTPASAEKGYLSAARFIWHTRPLRSSPRRTDPLCPPGHSAADLQLSPGIARAKLRSVPSVSLPLPP